MKKSILSLAIVALLFAGCSNKKSNEHSHDSEGNHTNTESVHEHEDHQDVEHHQEEFKVASDTSAVKNAEEHGHSHEDGNHKH
jgi:PBP1b-binding outer membrane lipoprotein LpoB